MNVNALYDLSIQTVKKACERYWLDKDVSYFMNRMCTEDAPAIGLDCGDEDGFYKIEESSYKAYVQNDNTCIVTADLILYDTEKVFMFKENVEVTVMCVQEDGEIRFQAVHMSMKRKKVALLDTSKSPSFYYKKLMRNLCDLLIETKAEGDSFVFNEDEYYELFRERRKFTNMDQWFWHLCENFVLEQDLEKLDLFRDSDVEKRLLNDDLVIDTTFRIKREQDEIIWVHMVIAFILDITGETIGDVFIMLSDCTKEMTEKMNNLEFARMDFLTHTWNRRYTEELIEEKMRENKNGIFILFDIDKFKNVNDSYGHLTGDDLLIKICANVADKLYEGDVFGRLGGDEFVLWLAGSGDKEADKIRIWEIFESTKFHYMEKGVEMDIHCSAGVVFYDEDVSDFEELYARADKAMYQAKGAGRNTIVIA